MFVGIPALVLLDEKNDLITTTGRTVIARDPEGQVGMKEEGLKPKLAIECRTVVQWTLDQWSNIKVDTCLVTTKSITVINKSAFLIVI